MNNPDDLNEIIQYLEVVLRELKRQKFMDDLGRYYEELKKHPELEAAYGAEDDEWMLANFEDLPE